MVHFFVHSGWTFKWKQTDNITVYLFDVVTKHKTLIRNVFNHLFNYMGLLKNVMQGKLIAVAYTLRTYWNQFSLGRISTFFLAFICCPYWTIDLLISNRNSVARNCAELTESSELDGICRTERNCEELKGL